MFERFGLAAALAAVSAPAFACSCPPLKTDAARQEYKQNYANHSVKLQLKSFRLRIASNADATAEAVAEVLEQPKAGAPLPSHILVESPGGDENANCGSASVLFSAASTQRWLRAIVTKTRDGRYGIGGCSPMDMEPWPINAALPPKNN
jgi:hypothetical protein